VAAASFSEEEKKMAFPEEEGVKLLVTYTSAREARESERRSFRDESSVENVEGKLASLTTSFQALDPNEGQEAEAPSNKRRRESEVAPLSRST